MPQRVVALELDDYELKAAVLESSFRDYRVIELFRESFDGTDEDPTPSPEHIQERLRTMLQKPEMDGATVLSCLPGNLVTWRTLTLPFRDKKRLDQTVPFELESVVPFDLDEVVISYDILHQNKTSSTLLAALVQREDLQAHLSLLAGAGADPKLVDIVPLSALNALRLLGDAVPDTFVYIGGNCHRAHVALYREGKLAGIRSLTQPAAGEHAATDGADGDTEQPNATAYAQAMAHDMRWTLTALNGGPFEADVPCFLGTEEAMLGEVGDAVAEWFQLKLRRLEQIPMGKVPVRWQKEIGGFTAPLGLALREVAPTGTHGVNFRVGEFTYHHAQEEVRRALMRSAMIAACAVGLMFTQLYLDHQRLSDRVAALQAQIRMVGEQTLPESYRVVDARTQLQAEIDIAQEKLDLLSQMAPLDGATAIDATQALSTAIPPSIKIDISEYMMDPEFIRIRAATDSFESVDLIKQKVLSTGYFGDVEVKDVKAGRDGGDVKFRLMLFFGAAGTKKGAVL